MKPNETGSFKVITTRTAPGAPHSVTIEEQVMGTEELSTLYPRSATYGGSLVIAQYEVQTGEYDADTYREVIVPFDESTELSEDPRLLDTDIDPSKLPTGYEVGEGYANWQARANGGEYRHGGRYYTPGA